MAVGFYLAVGYAAGCGSGPFYTVGLTAAALYATMGRKIQEVGDTGVFAADWNAIKTEYVTTQVSCRKLAEKYGVSYHQVYVHSKKENWVGEREKWQQKTFTKKIDAAAKSQVRRVERLRDITDKLLTKIERTVDVIDEADPKAHRQIASAVKIYGQITAALKEIKDVQMLKSEGDIREQEARIKKLQRDAEADKEDHEVVIRFEGGGDMDKYSG